MFDLNQKKIYDSLFFNNFAVWFFFGGGMALFKSDIQ